MDENTRRALARVPITRVARPVRFPIVGGAGQRAARRRPLRGTIHLREAGTVDFPLPLEVDEISATGAFILSDLLLPVGTELDLLFELPETATTTAGSVQASAEVVRVDQDTVRPGMGVIFRQVPPAARAALRAYTSWN